MPSLHLNRWVHRFGEKPNKPGSVQDKTKDKYASFESFRKNPIPSLQDQQGTILKECCGPWMSDEVPDDGMQKWILYCWTTNSDNKYLERLKRRHEVEPLHDIWARWCNQINKFIHYQNT